MLAGSAEHGSCLRDLIGIRARTEQRARDEAAVRFLTCGSPRGIAGNRDPMGEAAAVGGAVIGRYDCQ